MFTVILVMLSGMLLGRLLRNRRMAFLPRVVMFLIWVLLGANPEIIRNLKSLGVEAFVLAVAGTLGSAVLAWALWRYAERSGER